jgi:hypothetical protein
MRKYGVIGGAISITCVMAIVFFCLHGRRPAAASPPGVQYELSPYNLAADDLAQLQTGAAGGDCKAAKILTRYYFDVALDPYSGLKWNRVAAKKCPDAEPKVGLVIFLMNNKNDPENAAEIADLIVQIQKIDPYRAAELKSELGSK